MKGTPRLLILILIPIPILILARVPLEEVGCGGAKRERHRLEDFEDDRESVRILLNSWNRRAEPSGSLITIFGSSGEMDYGGIEKLSREVFEEFGMPTTLVSVEHPDNVLGIRPTMEAGSFVLLLFLDVLGLRRLLGSPYLANLWHPRSFYVLRQIGRDSEGEARRGAEIEEAPYRFLRWALERIWRVRRVDGIVVSVREKYIRYDPFDPHDHSHRSHLPSPVTGAEEAEEEHGHECHHRRHHGWSDHRPHEGLIVDERKREGGGYVFEARRDFEGYGLTVSIFETGTMTRNVRGDYGGVDAKVMKEVCRMMNVTPIFRTTRHGFGWKEDGGAYVGSLADIVYGHADVTFNEYFVKDYRSEAIEMATYLSTDRLCVLVPRAHPVPDYLVLVRIFAIDAWIAILGFLVAVPVAREILERLDRCSSEDKPPPPLPFESSSPSGRRPNRRLFLESLLRSTDPSGAARAAIPERVLLICSLYAGLVLNGIFTSKLTMSFREVARFGDVETLEDLDGTGLPILTNSPDLLKSVLSDDGDEEDESVISRLRKKIKYVTDVQLKMRLFENEDVAVFRRKGYMHLTMSGKKRSRVHLVEECPKTYALAPMVTKGSPFLERINDVIGRLHNGGFYKKWFEAMAADRRKSKRKEDVEDTKTYRKVTLQHLYVPFAILFLGLAASLVAFACECRGGY